MKTFFAFYYSDLPNGSGFKMYGFVHFAFFFAIAAGIAITCVAYRRAAPDRRTVYLRVTASLCLFLEIFKNIVMLITLPEYPISQLPLHLCGLGIFIEFVDAFAPRRSVTIDELLFSLSFPGAVAALTFPDWTIYPVFNIYCLQSFIIHGVLLCYPLMLLTSGQLRPKLRNLWRSAVFLIVVAPPIYLVNLHFHTDFLYINGGAPGSPIELLETLMGNPGYLAGYAALVVVIWFFMYAIYAVLNASLKRLNIRQRTAM